MDDSKTAICNQCGKAILPVTARLTSGMCRTCERKTIAERRKIENAEWAAAALTPISKTEFELLLSQGLEDTCTRIFDNAHLKWLHQGVASLTQGQLDVISVEKYIGEMCNGGVSQYLSNNSGELLPHLPEALDRVGLGHYANGAVRLRQYFPHFGVKVEHRLAQIEAFLSKQGEDTFKSLDEDFAEAHSRDCLKDAFRNKIFEYIRNNRGEFVSK